MKMDLFLKQLTCYDSADMAFVHWAEGIGFDSSSGHMFSQKNHSRIIILIQIHKSNMAEM